MCEYTDTTITLRGKSKKQLLKDLAFTIKHMPWPYVDHDIHQDPDGTWVAVIQYEKQNGQ